MKIFVATFIIALFITLLLNRQKVYRKNTADAMINEQMNTDVFVLNKNEWSAIQAASKKSLDELLDDINNPASFYVLGHGILQAQEQRSQPDAEEIKNAYYCFARAASLGFSPALYQIWRMFIDGVVPMPTFLAMVYLNLAATQHPELNSFYSALRSAALSKSGKRIVQEIERIADYKKNIINQNKELLHMQQTLKK